MKCAYTGMTIHRWTDHSSFSDSFKAYMGPNHFTSWYHAIQWLLQRGDDPGAAACFHEIEEKLEGSWPGEVPVKAAAGKTFTVKNTHPRFFTLLTGTKEALLSTEAPQVVTARMARPFIMTYMLCIPADSTKIPTLDVVPYAKIWPVLYENLRTDCALAVKQVTDTDFSAVWSPNSTVPNGRANGLAPRLGNPPFQGSFHGDVWFFRHGESPAAKLVSGTLTPAWKKFLAKAQFEFDFTRRTGIKPVAKKDTAVPMSE